MALTFGKILVLTLFAFISEIDNLTFQLGFGNVIVAGTFTGIVLGDIKLGLAVGATLQLASLGIATYGGASVPNYKAAAIIGTAFSHMTGQDIEFGVAVAVPVGILLTHIGTLVRFINVYFQNRAQDYASEGDTGGITRSNIATSLVWGLGDAIPIFLALYFGSDVVNFITQSIPEWLLSGLAVSGKVLPAMGIAILMRYLPLKKYYPFMILGFTIVAFMGVDLVGVALIGFSFAAISILLDTDKINEMGGDIDD